MERGEGEKKRPEKMRYDDTSGDLVGLPPLLPPHDPRASFLFVCICASTYDDVPLPIVAHKDEGRLGVALGVSM